MAELVNKMNGPWFNRFDEDLATAFSIYCGISIAHVSIYHCAQRGRQTTNAMTAASLLLAADSKVATICAQGKDSLL